MASTNGKHAVASFHQYFQMYGNKRHNNPQDPCGMLVPFKFKDTFLAVAPSLNDIFVLAGGSNGFPAYTFLSVGAITFAQVDSNGSPLFTFSIIVQTPAGVADTTLMLTTSTIGQPAAGGSALFEPQSVGYPLGGKQLAIKVTHVAATFVASAAFSFYMELNKGVIIDDSASIAFPRETPY
jgi:hypothetical protein